MVDVKITMTHRAIISLLSNSNHPSPESEGQIPDTKRYWRTAALQSRGRKAVISASTLMAARDQPVSGDEGSSQRLGALIQQLRQYRAPTLDEDDDDDDVDEQGKVFSQVGFPQSAAPPIVTRPERFRPKSAAVLICLFEGEAGELRVILTKRSSRLSTHSGEVSLPGGKAEEGDADDTATALREAKEEIGLDPEMVTVVTVLEPFLSKHLLRVVPVVGVLLDRQAFSPIPNPDEVEAIFDAPLEMFLKDEKRRYDEREWMGSKFLIHYFDYETENRSFVIWGLTAGILVRAASVVYQKAPSFVEQNPKFKIPRTLNGENSLP